MDQNYALTPSKYLIPSEKLHLEDLMEKYRRTDLRDTTMILFMLKTGARPQEVLNLLWEDIDEARLRVFIRTLKRGKARYVPIRKDLLNRLKSLGPGQPGERVFKIGYNMFRLVWDKFRPVKKKLHCLRHTFAVSCYRKSNYNLRQVQLLLGHKSLMTTAIYLEVEASDSEMRQCID